MSYLGLLLLLVLVILARSQGLEPRPPRFEAWCSIQLSYERDVFVNAYYMKTDVQRLRSLLRQQGLH